MSLPTLNSIKDTLTTEAKAIQSIANDPKMLEQIRDAAVLVAKSNTPLIVAGIGKSGHIARKIASTFCSLGHRASFLHAAEASHGDLGIIADGCPLLILSNSGETSELSDLLAYAREHGHPIVGLTANRDSTLGRESQIALAYGKQTEACRNGLAPTTSTTISLAIGDALAVAVSEIHQIQPADFRRYHPGGKLGARLARVSDLMLSGDQLPIVTPDTTMAQAVINMSTKNLGVLLVQENNQITGIVTDGDMRRHADTLMGKTVGEIASDNPISTTPDATIDQAVAMMGEKGITSALVRDADMNFLGLIHIHDCLKGTS